MILRDMVNRFESEAPFAVMVRATLENALAVLDPDLHLIRDVFPCEDGHAQERSLLSDVVGNRAAA